MRKQIRGIMAGALFSAAGLSVAPAAAAQPFMPSGGKTTQPIGHFEFCQDHSGECSAQRTAGPVHLSRSLWATIIDVNNDVNLAVAPKTDLEMWGREEVWSYPGRQGDCEDYVLEKRRRLAESGVPASTLLITVVRQPNGDGHAVLTVRTDMGDYVLDNMEPRVLAWNETEYRFLKRQSERNAGQWVSVSDDRQIAVGSVR